MQQRRWIRAVEVPECGVLVVLGKYIYKAGYLISGQIRNVWMRLKLRLIWRIGKGCVFQGAVHVYSIGGDVFVGSKTIFGPHVNVCAAKGGRLSIGDGCSVNQGAYVCARADIVIGNNVLIGEYASVRDNDHGWRDPSVLIRDQGFVSLPVVIEDDVWIGRGVVVCKGVRIGQGSVIGAGAIVTKDVEPYSVVVGNPARLIKSRI